jgi:hypothetical protein
MVPFQRKLIFKKFSDVHVSHICTHKPQCILGTPKPPPPRLFSNGDGLTVNLPNWSSKRDIQTYEAEFGDHKCEDCNEEFVVIETGAFYKVNSCGNNLVKFEDCSWWDGEGDFSTREQQRVSILVDV